MDRTSGLGKLIRWQRITIGALLAALGITALSASRSQSLVGTYQRSEARWKESTTWRQQFHQREEVDFARSITSEYDQLHIMHKTDQRIIRDLRERLHKYEAKYGKISPVRRGESVTVGNLGLKPQVDR
jgi:hypothetical protein